MATIASLPSSGTLSTPQLSIPLQAQDCPSPKPEVAASSSLHFLSLPTEVRIQIYAELVGARQNKYHLKDGYAKYQFHLNILSVNKQIYDEARETFRRQNIFCKIITPWREAEEHVAVEGRVPVVLVGPKATTFKDVHMAAEVDIPDMDYPCNSNSVLLLCLDDVPGFCKMWFYSDLSHTGLNTHLRLNLRLQNPSPLPWSTVDCDLPRPVQRSLLDPFIMIKGLQKVSVEGKVDDIVRKEFYERIAEPYEAPEACLARCDALKEAGNEAMKNGKYREAITSYEESFTAMHIVVVGRRRHIWGDHHFDKRLVGGAYDKQDGNYVRMILRIKLVANMILAHYKLELFDDAKFWGMRSITMMRDALGQGADVPKPDFAASGSWGQIYYRTGLACRELEDHDGAREMFRIAAEWLPDDPLVQKEKAATTLMLL